MMEEVQLYYKDKNKWVKMVEINGRWYIYWPCGENETHNVASRHIALNEGNGTYTMPIAIRCNKCGWRVSLKYSTLEDT